MTIAARTRLGPYEILTPLGAGGMGEVYLAEDTKLGRKVAIKFLPTDSVANEQAYKRLLREARAAAMLDHPNICAIHEVSDADGRSFIVMQYVDGVTLESRMKSRPLDWSECLSLSSQVADALAEAHAHGIIHRDIKPSNILITPRGKVKVLDFGLAKFVSHRVAVDTEAETAMLLTETGVVLGTAPYMSPEQLRAEPLDGRSDIFSYGTVLYEIVSGRRPFEARSLAELTSAILMREPPPLQSQSGVMPAGLEPLILKCLEKEPAGRYQTMAELLVDLDRISREWESLNVSASINEARAALMDVDASTRRMDWRRLAKSRAALAIIVLAVFAMAMLGYMRIFRNRTRSNESDVKYQNSPAYTYYLRGRVNVSSENPENNENAIKLLEQAVSADPNFAPAWANLARAYSIKSQFFAPRTEKKKLNEDARVDIERALSLDPNLAEGHVVRGVLLWTPDNRFPHEQAIGS